MSFNVKLEAISEKYSSRPLGSRARTELLTRHQRQKTQKKIWVKQILLKFKACSVGGKASRLSDKGLVYRIYKNPKNSAVKK